MSEKILGLELSSDSLTAVVIQKSFNQYTLVDAFWTPYKSKESVVEESSKENTSRGNSSISHIEKNNTGNFNSVWKWDSESFEKALNIILSKIDVKGCSSSALCLPAYLISFRALNLPFVSESKVRQILSYELTAHLPMNNSYISDFISLSNLNEINNSDFISNSDEPILSKISNVNRHLDNITNNSKKKTLKNKNEHHIFTASLPINIIDSFFSILKQNGLELELVTTKGFFTKSFIINGWEINSNAFNSFLSFARKKKRLDNSLFHFLGKVDGIRNYNRVNELNVLIEVTKFETIISFIWRKNIVAIRSFVGKKDIAFIEKTISQTILGLHQKYNKEILSINKINIGDYIDIKALVNIPNSSNNSVLSKKFQDLVATSINTSDNLKWFNSVAAALFSIKRRDVINFCQAQYAKNSFFHKFKDKLVVLSIFAIISFIAFFINIEVDILNLKKEVKTIDSAITEIFKRTFPDVKTLVEPLMQMQVKMRELEQSGFGLRQGASALKIRVIDILYELSNKIPENIDIEFTRFLLSEGRVVIAGNTDNFNTIDRVKTMLEQYDKFKNVTINSAAADKTGNRVLFNFIIELRSNI